MGDDLTEAIRNFRPFDNIVHPLGIPRPVGAVIENITEPDSNLHLDPQAEYYDIGGVSVLDVIKAKLREAKLSPYEGFLLGNIIKYSLRLPYKGTPERDADKIRIYADKLIEELKDLDNPTE